jgi:hypothetical protein
MAATYEFKGSDLLMNLTAKLISLLGASCIVAFASAAPASADTKPCCFNDGQYFNSTPTTCNRYGGRVVPQEYCDRNYNGYNGRYDKPDASALFEILLGIAVLGYEDGYYDRDRRWHRWRNDNERDWFRQRHRDKYFDVRRDRDRDRNRRDWRNGRRKDWRRDSGRN